MWPEGIQTSSAISTANLNTKFKKIPWRFTESLQQHKATLFSNIYTLEFSPPTMTSEIIQDIYDKLSPSISLGLHESPVPFSQQESLVCYTSKQSISSYFLLRNIFVFRQFKYESHPCSCIRQKDKYIISAPEPKHLVLIHTHTHTRILSLSLSLSLSLTNVIFRPLSSYKDRWCSFHYSAQLNSHQCQS